jgi:phage terminase Nu1 subunit (DNA packaging protein)
MQKNKKIKRDDIDTAIPKSRIARKQIFLLLARVLSKNTLATIMGVEATSVDRWVITGCPKNDDDTFNLADVVTWRTKHLQGEHAKPRGALSEQKTQAEIELLRAKIAHLQETTMLRAEHNERMGDFARAIKEYFLNGARKVASDFVNVRTVQIAQERLIQFIVHGVNGLAGK